MARRSRFQRKFYDAIETFLRWNPRKRVIVLCCAGVLPVAVILAIAIPKKSEQPVSSQQTQSIKLSPATAQSVASGDDRIVEISTSTPTPAVASTPAPTPTPDPTLKRGDENERVTMLQERLMKLGYMDIDETTQLFGPATEYAVKLFQRQHELQQDGIAGTETLNLIYSDKAKKYTLLEGTRGTDVDSLQRQLISLGYLNKATGYYGTETIAAVKEFQERNNLEADGKTGPITLDLIYSPNAKESKTKAKAEKRRANILTMLKVANDLLGKPYVLGNEGPHSFDCSGFVYYCLKEAGSSRNRYNAAGYSKVEEWDKITSMSDLEKGDLLFFWNDSKSKVGHVGIYVGSGNMIDASSSNGKVIKRSCTTSYWKKMFVFARRPW